jgi:hypothetical protein
MLTYDPQADALTIRLRDEKIKEGEEVRPGLIVDFGKGRECLRPRTREGSPIPRGQGYHATL